MVTRVSSAKTWVSRSIVRCSPRPRRWRSRFHHHRHGPGAGHAAPAVPRHGWRRRRGAWLIYKRQRQAKQTAEVEAKKQQDLAPVQRPAEAKGLGWDDVTPVVHGWSGSRVPADPHGRSQPGWPVAGADQGRAQEAVPGPRFPHAVGTHPRQPGPAAQRLSSDSYGRQRGRGRDLSRPRTGHQPGQVYGSLNGVAAKDPAFGLEAVWIDVTQRDQAQSSATPWSMPAPWSPPTSTRCSSSTPTS